MIFKTILFLEVTATVYDLFPDIRKCVNHIFKQIVKSLKRNRRNRRNM